MLSEVNGIKNADGIGFKINLSKRTVFGSVVRKGARGLLTAINHCNKGRYLCGIW